MINLIINLIIYLLVIGILYYLFVYVVDNFIPEPPQKILKVVGRTARSTATSLPASGSGRKRPASSSSW